MNRDPKNAFAKSKRLGNGWQMSKVAFFGIMPQTLNPSRPHLWCVLHGPTKNNSCQVRCRSPSMERGERKKHGEVAFRTNLKAQFWGGLPSNPLLCNKNLWTNLVKYNFFLQSTSNPSWNWREFPSNNWRCNCWCSMKPIVAARLFDR